MPHLTRYYMYRQLREYFKEPMSGKILGISGIAEFHPLINKNADITDGQFPEIDMQDSVVSSFAPLTSPETIT